MISVDTIKKLETAVQTVAAHISDANELTPWRKTEERILWYELVSCILGSRVKFEISVLAAERLEQSGLLEPGTHQDNYDSYEAKIYQVLMGASETDLTRANHRVKYPFPRLRANHIRRSAENVYGQNQSLQILLKSSASASEARNRLTAVIVGCGPKQASLFLRNVGFSDNVAILDVHVLRYMMLLGLASKSEIGVQKIRQYITLENILQEYAKKMKTKLSVLDTAIWVVMRVHNREVTVWA